MMLKIMTEKQFQEKLREEREKVYEEVRINRRFEEVHEQFDRLYKRICILEDKLSLPKAEKVIK